MTVSEEECHRPRVIGRNAIVQWCSLILIVLTVSYRSCFYNTVVPYITQSSGDLIQLKEGQSKHDNDAEKHAESTGQNTPSPDVSDLDTFRADNLVSSPRIPCGKNKCFFLVKSDNQVGYLVARSTEYDWQAILDSAWKLATSLEREVGMKHFLEGPPLNVSVTSDLRSVISAGNLWRVGRNHYIEEDYFPERSTVYIQRNRVAPAQHLLNGYSGTKRKIFARELDGFLSNVTDIESFTKAFNESISITEMILNKEPCLFNDFHIMMDTSGWLYHLDFDRCFSLANETHGSVVKRDVSEKLKDACLSILDDMRALVTSALERNMTAPT